MKKQMLAFMSFVPAFIVGTLLLFSCQDPLMESFEDESLNLKKGGKPTDVEQGDLYGDLWELERDDRGVPVLYTLEYLADYQDIRKQDTINIVNPRLNGEFDLDIVCRDASGLIIFEDGEPKKANVHITPDANGFATIIGDVLTPAVLYDLEGEILPDVALHVYPVEEGRLNIIRSPASVLEKRMTEVIKNFGDGTVGDVVRDYCGRLFMVRTDLAISQGNEDKPIDSPLENLAIYYELMINGFDNSEDENGLSFLTRSNEDNGFGLKCHVDNQWGNGPQTINVLADKQQIVANLAAACLAAGSDKSNTLTIDEIIFLNQFMGIPKVEGGVVSCYFPYVTQNVRMINKTNKDVITKTRYYVDYTFFSYTRDKFYHTMVDFCTIVIDYNDDGTVAGTHLETIIPNLSVDNILTGSAGILDDYRYSEIDESKVQFDGAPGFANQADDYVQALEVVHNNEEFLPWQMPTPTWAHGTALNTDDSPFSFEYVEPDHSKKPEGKGDDSTTETSSTKKSGNSGRRGR